RARRRGADPVATRLLEGLREAGGPAAARGDAQDTGGQLSRSGDLPATVEAIRAERCRTPVQSDELCVVHVRCPMLLIYDHGPKPMRRCRTRPASCSMIGSRA